VVTYVLYRRIKQQYSGGEIIKVVAAAKPLDTGTPLTG